MKNNEFGLTFNGDITGTFFKKIEEFIVPYFKDIEKLIFHDNGHNVTIENKNWDIYIPVKCFNRRYGRGLPDEHTL